jgi:predicted PurR-regulated permease PerM
VRILQTARDIAVIVLAGITLVAFGLFIWLIASIISFLRTLKEDLKPILKAGEETFKTVSNLVKIITDSLSGPLEGVLKPSRKGSFAFKILSRLLRRRRRKK